MKNITASITAILLFLVIAGCSRNAKLNTLEIQGSDTMVNLAQAWAQEFMVENPEIGISVNGGGSSVGIQALINGTTEIANASREMKPEEMKSTKAEGVNPIETIVGYDGIVVAVSRQNPIDKLTIGQLSDIFTGKTKNWKEIGGDDCPIVIFSRESSSGTYEFFKDHVLNGDEKKGKNFAAQASLLNNSSQIVDQVAHNRNAIGYFGMGFSANNIKELAIAADESSEYVMPTIKNIKNKSYSISRSLQIYTPEKAKKTVRDFLDFVLGQKGQNILEEAGFVALR